MFLSNLRTAHVLGLVAALVGLVSTQSQPAYQTRNLTPDGYWHNRYHAYLSMAAYGPYNSTCPVQTFTEETMLKNFPESTRDPWTVLETWDTPSGCSGFSAIVPEMNKVLLVFRGNWALEQNLSTTVTNWTSLGRGIGSTCQGCTMNQFALQGYLEAKNATNDFEITRNAYYGAGLVFSITGHGLGGMHALIASVDFNYQRICYYSHNYGTPRTFNQAGVNWYNARFNGEAGERGLFNNDQTQEIIPASEDYVFSGTTFYYWEWGVNSTSGVPNWAICWPDDEGYLEDPACTPRPGGSGTNSTAEDDHYFYFTPVGQCGQPQRYSLSTINQFLTFEQDPANANATFYPPSVGNGGNNGGSGGNGGNGGYYTTSTRSRSTVNWYTPTSSSTPDYTYYDQPSTTSTSTPYRRTSSSTSSSRSNPKPTVSSISIAPPTAPTPSGNGQNNGGTGNGAGNSGSGNGNNNGNGNSRSSSTTYA